jgi:uncharacterized protein (DUF2267 family)
MYIVYLDQPKTFECSIQLEGASISNSKARLIMETKEGLNFIFNGKISDNGKVSIPVTKLKNIIKEEQKGKLTLEVIADDVYFSPWSSDFETALMKKVQVTVNEEITKPSKPTLSVVVDEPKKEPTKKVDHLLEIVYLLTKNKITILNIKENQDRLSSIVDKYVVDRKLDKYQLNKILTKLPQKLYELTYSK